jgi:hypothetical protein
MPRIKLRISFIFLNLFFHSVLFSQIGGTSTWNFLSLTTSARIAALGGKVAAIADDDLNLVYQNPSLLTPAMHNSLVLNYVNYFTDIAYGYVSYARTFNSVGTFAVGIHYIDYGNFIAADPTGLITGNFTAAEYALNLNYSRSIDSNITVGICIKPIYSALENYQSYGLAADMGACYTSDDRLFAASVSVRNLGTQFKGYYAKSYEPLPFEIMAGFSQKLAHAPFRFVVTAQQIQRLDLTYTTPEESSKVDPLSGDAIKKNKLESFSDKTMRHMIVGVEFLPMKAFCFRFGYNHKLRKEMATDFKPAMVGFSWGFGLNLSRFQLNYGRAAYHLAGATNIFSISTNLSSFGKKSNPLQN